VSIVHIIIIFLVFGSVDVKFDLWVMSIVHIVLTAE
jgi:hypothetical protein